MLPTSPPRSTTGLRSEWGLPLAYVYAKAHKSVHACAYMHIQITRSHAKCARNETIGPYLSSPWEFCLYIPEEIGICRNDNDHTPRWPTPRQRGQRLGFTRAI